MSPNSLKNNMLLNFAYNLSLKYELFLLVIVFEIWGSFSFVTPD